MQHVDLRHHRGDVDAGGERVDRRSVYLLARLRARPSPTCHISVPSILPIGKRLRRRPASTTLRISLPDATSS